MTKFLEETYYLVIIPITVLPLNFTDVTRRYICSDGLCHLRS